MKRLARRAFGFLQAAFVQPTGNTYVYELSGEIAGVVVLSTFAYMRNRCGGVVKWLFTAPEARGRGAATALVEYSVTRLQELGCDELFTTVEGFNTASSNRFADLGFIPLSPMQQMRRYGLSLFKIAANTFHTFDVGHFLWARPASRSASVDNEARFSGGGARAWWVNVVITAAIIAAQRLRVGATDALQPHLLWQLPVAVTLVFGVRSVAMKLTARRLALPSRYRIWETGLTVSTLIAVAFGGVFPSPGSYYPETVRWSYRAELRRVAAVAASGAAAVLVLAWLLLAYELGGFERVPAPLHDMLGFAVFLSQGLLVFEILLPFFPFGSYNGRRVWDLHRGLWAVLAIATAALYVVRSLG